MLRLQSTIAVVLKLQFTITEHDATNVPIFRERDIQHQDADNMQ